MRGEEETATGGRGENKRKGKKIRERREEKAGNRKKEKGSFCEVKGHFRETMKTEEGGCKMPGGGKRKSQGKPGETLGLEVRWAWAGLGCSLARSNFYFLLQINFGKLMLKTETTVSVKLFRQF